MRKLHGVAVRPVCVNASQWDCTLEPGKGPHLAVRLGFRMAKGLAKLHGGEIVAKRGDAPYRSMEEAWRRAGVPVAALERLAEADAFHALGLQRRDALWAIRALSDARLPLFESAAEAESARKPVQPLPLPLWEGGGGGVVRSTPAAG